MSQYYELKQKAGYDVGIESLGDMQIDAIGGILKFANQMIDKMQKDIEKCNLDSIANSSFHISQQIEYARGVSHESMRIMPSNITEKTNSEITDVELRFRKISDQIKNACVCSKR